MNCPSNYYRRVTGSSCLRLRRPDSAQSHSSLKVGLATTRPTSPLMLASSANFRQPSDSGTILPRTLSVSLESSLNYAFAAIYVSSCSQVRSSHARHSLVDNSCPLSCTARKVPRSPESASMLALTSLTLFASLAIAQMCHFPDQETISGDTVCFPNLQYSPCCGNGYDCTTQGLCQNGAAFFVRGSCSDRSWSSPDCPQLCLDVYNNGENLDAGNVIWPCTGSTYEGFYYCNSNYYTEGSDCIGAPAFEFPGNT